MTAEKVAELKRQIFLLEIERVGFFEANEVIRAYLEWKKQKAQK